MLPPQRPDPHHAKRAASVTRSAASAAYPWPEELPPTIAPRKCVPPKRVRLLAVIASAMFGAGPSRGRVAAIGEIWLRPCLIELADVDDEGD